jgi:hypothetical protein
MSGAAAMGEEQPPVDPSQVLDRPARKQVGTHGNPCHCFNLKQIRAYSSISAHTWQCWQRVVDSVSSTATTLTGQACASRRSPRR